MLILMDTAISLLNVNEPVYPLDIVKNMRDQRPCMVQNVVSIFILIRFNLGIFEYDPFLRSNSINIFHTKSLKTKFLIVIFCLFLVSVQVHMRMYIC